MKTSTIIILYWVIAAMITIYIQTQQNKKISTDGVIGNTPAFTTLMAVLGGGIYAPIYGIIKLIRFIKKFFDGGVEVTKVN